MHLSVLAGIVVAVMLKSDPIYSVKPGVKPCVGALPSIPGSRRRWFRFLDL
jgi:hypothetical protein